MSMFWKAFVCVLFSLNLTYLFMFFQAHTLQYKVLSESQLVKEDNVWKFDVWELDANIHDMQ